MGVKYSVNEKFFDTWNEEVAYVLGYLYADGSLENASGIRGKYVRVSSTDKDRIDTIRSLLGSRHTIIRIDGTDNHKTKYLLRIGNHALYDGLVSHGVTPHKSMTMRFPKVPLPYLSAFVRGYFDGDGCAHIDVVHGKPKRLLTIFTSGSRAFLMALHRWLVIRIGMVGSGLYKHGSTKGAYQLRYSTRDSLRLFLFMYPSGFTQALCMGRKYAIFEKYLELRGVLRSDIPRILKQKGPVAK